MKIWKLVKSLEDDSKRDTVKLPAHNRSKFFWVRLPRKAAYSTVVHSLKSAIIKLAIRYAIVFGLRIEYSAKVVGKVGTNNHAYDVRVKIYFKK